MTNINCIKENIGYCSNAEKLQLMELVKFKSFEYGVVNLSFYSTNCSEKPKLFQRFSYSGLFDSILKWRSVNELGSIMKYEIKYSSSPVPEVNIAIMKVDD